MTSVKHTDLVIFIHWSEVLVISAGIGEQSIHVEVSNLSSIGEMHLGN